MIKVNDTYTCGHIIYGSIPDSIGGGKHSEDEAPIINKHDKVCPECEAADPVRRGGASVEEFKQLRQWLANNPIYRSTALEMGDIDYRGGLVIRNLGPLRGAFDSYNADRANGG